MECIWRTTSLEEDALVVYMMGFDERRYLTIDLESDKVSLVHWVVVVSPLEYKQKQQVKNLKTTHWRIESVLSLAQFCFVKESNWRLMRKNCFFSYFATNKHGRQKVYSHTFDHSDKIKDFDNCRFSVSPQFQQGNCTNSSAWFAKAAMLTKTGMISVTTFPL